MKILDKGNVDILFIGEGTYPYIKGGVSSWMHSIIEGMPEFNFGVIFLGSRPEDYGDIQYQLPENLSFLATYYLFDKREKAEPKIIQENKEKLKKTEELHSWIKKQTYMPVSPEELFSYLEEIREKDFLYGKWAWKFMTDRYFENAVDTPFIDFFWTIRNIHYPIWEIANIVKEICPFKVIHSPSTGYAGFLATLLKSSKRKPFILTEHGIYIRERKIDIVNASWIKSGGFFYQKEVDDLDYLKKIWIDFFRGIGYFTYVEANKIYSLFKDAKKAQIELGAPAEKTEIIPNGVKVDSFIEARKKRPEKTPKVVGLIGRVVSIKDIKTFIKAMRIVTDKIPDAEGWVIGPTDEDPNYYAECVNLRNALNLNGKVKFLGFKNLKEIFPEIGITTLTSISEGMPLVVLESFAAGVPVVTTDVGSCRQLLYGELNEEDRQIGKAGIVCKVANPSELANGYIKLLTDQNLWNEYRENAIKRVEKFYTFKQFIETYKKTYREFLSGGNSV